MKAMVGRYFFKRHHGSWGIWQWDSTSSASHIKDEWCYEDAVKETYRLNGRGIPKSIVRAY